MLVLGALEFRDRKETDGTNLFCYSDCETIGILEDEDDDDSSNPEFRFKRGDDYSVWDEARTEVTVVTEQFC